jgi:hypothetical protein
MKSWKRTQNNVGAVSSLRIRDLKPVDKYQIYNMLRPENHVTSHFVHRNIERKSIHILNGVRGGETIHLFSVETLIGQRTKYVETGYEWCKQQS